MGKFSFIVHGIYFGAILLFLIFIGESIFPGSVASTTFTELGVLSVFMLLIMEALFDLDAE